jgi:4-hydroxybenzoate polyprenyltransferase
MLQLFRPINLLIIILTQGFVAFFLLNVPLQFPHTIPYLLLAISTTCIAAGGYVINDIYDQHIDSINKPQKQIIGKLISQKRAWQIYIFLSAISLIISALLGVNFLIIHTITGILLYLYSAYFKKIALLGNGVVAILSAISAVLPILINSFQNILLVNIPTSIVFLFIYSLLISFIREIIKDVQDIEGDKIGGCRTFPILFGVINSKKLITALWLILTVFNIIYRAGVNEKIANLVNPENSLVYLQFYLLIVMLASSTLTVVMWKIKTETEFKYLSIGCKLLMLLGVFAIPLLKYL